MKYNFNINPKIKLANPELALPNIIQVRGEISEETAFAFSEAIIAAQNNEQEIIPIVIDSFGGDVYAMFSMIDILKTCKVPIATIVCGKVMSAGSVLFSCGTEGYRYISPNSTVMIHHATQESDSVGNPHEARTAADQLEKINEKSLEMLAENCGKPKKYFKQLLIKNNHCDLYFTAEEALKHNIANFIKIPEFNVTVDMKYKFE